ncbi:hypothetical protein RFI_21118, partial [Reticulomyxa filosa]
MSKEGSDEPSSPSKTLSPLEQVLSTFLLLFCRQLLKQETNTQLKMAKGTKQRFGSTKEQSPTRNQRLDSKIATPFTTIIKIEKKKKNEMNKNSNANANENAKSMSERDTEKEAKMKECMKRLIKESEDNKRTLKELQEYIAKSNVIFQQYHDEHLKLVALQIHHMSSQFHQTAQQLRQHISSLQNEKLA